MSTKPYEIQKNVPIPAGKQGRKYPFLEMEIGDSFSVKLSDMRNTHTAIQDYKRRYDLHFVTKMYYDKGKQRMRVWRVEKPEEE